MPLSKSFLQSRVDFFFHDHIKTEFGKTIKMSLPESKGSTNRNTFKISALVTDLSQEDAKRLSVNSTEYRTVDIYKKDLDTLKANNPTAYIIYKNFQGLAEFTIEGSKYKVEEEKVDQQFESSIRLICVRIT